MSIIAWIVLGLGSGLLANAFVPGRREGIFAACLTGIIGRSNAFSAAVEHRLSVASRGAQPPSPNRTRLFCRLKLRRVPMRVRLPAASRLGLRWALHWAEPT
jgi:hypothetical protein